MNFPVVFKEKYVKFSAGKAFKKNVIFCSPLRGEKCFKNVKNVKNCVKSSFRRFAAKSVKEERKRKTALDIRCIIIKKAPPLFPIRDKQGGAFL